MNRVYNFSAGPTVLPGNVLEEAAVGMLDYRRIGMSVTEVSYRSKAYDTIIKEAESDLRDLLHIPDNCKVPFPQGDASQQFAMVPVDLIENKAADYILTGQRAKKVYREGATHGKANTTASSADKTSSYIPDCSDLPASEDADYVYICENSTIYGTRYWTLSNTKGKFLMVNQPLCFLSKPMGVTKYGLIFASVQKNVGPARTVIVITREDLVTENTLSGTPVIPCCKTHADTELLYSALPTYGIYMYGKVSKWLKARDNLGAMKEYNEKKVEILCDLLGESQLSKNTVAKKDRSLMNVSFTIGDEELDALSVKELKAAGFENLKGRRTVSGMYASIYNAIPVGGVGRLVESMAGFEKKHRE